MGKVRYRPPPDRSTTIVRRKPSLDFSITGLVYCSMMMFMGLAAINSQANLLFGVFGLMIGILLISGVISRIVLRRLTIRRVLPEYAEVGLTMTVTYQFQNRKGFWPSVSVSIAELDGVQGFTKQPQSYMLHAASGRTASVPTELVPKRRGVHEFNRYQVATSFPFGFIKRAIERSQRDSIVIFPPLGIVDPKLMQLCQSAEKTGSVMRPRRGGSDEFYGVKEYRGGESPRTIYWKRSARTGVLVSKEMTQVTPPRLLLLVDTKHAGTTADDMADIERSIANAASLASHAIDGGLLVGLIAWSDGWIVMSPERGKRHRMDVLAALAQLKANAAHGIDELMQHAQPVVEAGTTTLVFTAGTLVQSLGDMARSALIVVTAKAPQRNWFRYNQTVDFYTSMPPDQQPKLR